MAKDGLFTFPLPMICPGPCNVSLFSALHHVFLFSIYGQVASPDVWKLRGLGLGCKTLVSTLVGQAGENVFFRYELFAASRPWAEREDGICSPQLPEFLLFQEHFSFHFSQH
jgi:hypothetical protein